MKFHVTLVKGIQRLFSFRNMLDLTMLVKMSVPFKDSSSNPVLCIVRIDENQWKGVHGWHIFSKRPPRRWPQIRTNRRGRARLPPSAKRPRPRRRKKAVRQFRCDKRRRKAAFDLHLVASLQTLKLDTKWSVKWRRVKLIDRPLCRRSKLITTKRWVTRNCSVTRRRNIKSPKISKSCPKDDQSGLLIKMDAFKTAQKVNICLGYFCKKICHQNLSKIAKSGHTARKPNYWICAKRWARKRLRRVLGGGTSVQFSFGNVKKWTSFFHLRPFQMFML